MLYEKLVLHKERDVTLTCYIQEPSAEMPNMDTRPAVLVLPGGGYRFCSDREAEPVALAFMAEGYNAFVLRYSLGEDAKFPQPLRDAEQALALVAQNAEQWRVDKQKIVVAGFSAGGHLAAMLGVSGNVRPAALVLAYPCILEEIAEILPHPIPAANGLVDKSTPPTFLFATAADDLVPVRNTLAFAAALDDGNIPFEMHVFGQGVHGLSLAKGCTGSGKEELVNRAAARWLPMCIEWLEGLWENGRA